MSRVVVFDLDDTLYLERDFVESGFRAAGDWLADRHGIDGLASHANRLHGEGERGRIFDRTLERLGVNPDPALVKQLVQVYRTHRPEIRLLEDAEWALTQLSRRDIPLGLITDGYLETQKAKVEALSIERYFRAIVYSDALGREAWKPSTKPYLELMKRIGEPTAEHVYIGDNPSKDFVTAKQLGWYTVQVRREHGEYSRLEVEPSLRAHIMVDRLYQLKELLA